MSGYTGQEDYWGSQGGHNVLNFNTGESYNFSNQAELNFQDTGNYENVSNVSYYDPPKSFYNDDMYGPTGNFQTPAEERNEFEDEPPLLEELGIDFDRIMEKTLAVLNPFHKQGLTDDATFLTKDNDLAGPLVFCLALGASSFIVGGNANFGYVYGLAVTGCLLMYFLFSLMSPSDAITLTTVASIFGYCLLPVVVLSFLSIFVSFKGTVGIALAVIVVAWCSLSASRLYVTAMSSDGSQRILVAYPCILLYSVFVLLVIF